MRPAERLRHPRRHEDRPIDPGRDQPADLLLPRDLGHGLLVLCRHDRVPVGEAEADRRLVVVADDDEESPPARRAQEPELCRARA